MFEFNLQVSLEWPGFPAGVKFDPTDIELLEHLAGKIGLPNSKPHLFIDEFIPTLEDEQGICYAHPENLPGKAIFLQSLRYLILTICHLISDFFCQVLHEMEAVFTSSTEYPMHMLLDTVSDEKLVHATACLMEE